VLQTSDISTPASWPPLLIVSNVGSSVASTLLPGIPV
jgi:hypothetical protein